MRQGLVAAARGRSAMKTIGAGIFMAGILASAAASAQDRDAALKELAPTGKLRVAIAVSPAPSALYAIKDLTSGQYRGVSVDLGTELAKRLGVAVELVP